MIALGTYAVQHLTRGTLSGNGRFGPYGMILGAEGIFRILPVIVLYAAGVDDLVWYGLALAVPPVLASLVAIRGQHGLIEPGPEAEWSELSTNLTLLFLGLAGGPGPELRRRARRARARAGPDRARRRRRLHRRLLHRPHPDPPVPGGAGRAAPEAGRARRARASTPTSARACASSSRSSSASGASASSTGATIGPTVGEILFGDKFNLGSRDLALLFLGSAAFIFALTLAQALIALLGHGRALIAWSVGLVICVGVMALGSSATVDDLFLRAELGYLAGCATAAMMMLAFLMLQLRKNGPASLSLLVEAIEHEPLEI